MLYHTAFISLSYCNKVWSGAYIFLINQNRFVISSEICEVLIIELIAVVVWKKDTFRNIRNRFNLA